MPDLPSDETLLELITQLVDSNKLLIFDETNSVLHGSESITGVCVNGSAIQITLRDTDVREERTQLPKDSMN